MSHTYVIGDIHGTLPKLRALIARCWRHAERRPASFVFLGDYIDRGADSAGAVSAVIELQSQLGERVIALKGNHEAMAVDVIDGNASPDFWLGEGGAATLRSYGVEHARELPPVHIDWLRARPVSHDDGRRFFVHAGIDPQRPLDTQDERDLLWIREPFLSDPRSYDRLIVHGHTPRSDGAPDLRDNRLNLDTGAVFGGPLTAAVFSNTATMPIGFLQVE